MNIIQAGSRFQIYGEDVKTYKEIPSGSYDVNFSKMSGFSLSQRADLEVKEKVYGHHIEKVNKVFRAYDATNRNLGVILSGQKGAGKSLFARLLAKQAIERNIPVIVVSYYIPGIANFLSSIEQEVVVLFDEFEKSFGKSDDNDPQEELLSLFDGLDGGKKLYVITCNEVNKLNSYLLNRPGRFHYHFVINSPTSDEVREYMTDKLKPEYHYLIDRIIGFANTIDITYDYLRAIAFELNLGSSLEETFEDLNIMRTKGIAFDLIFRFSNGQEYTYFGKSLDLYSNKRIWVRCNGIKSLPDTCFEFAPGDIKAVNGHLTIDVSKVTAEVDSDAFWDEEDELRKKHIQEANKRVLSEVEIYKSVKDNYRYTV